MKRSERPYIYITSFTLPSEALSRNNKYDSERVDKRAKNKHNGSRKRLKSPDMRAECGWRMGTRYADRHVVRKMRALLKLKDLIEDGMAESTDWNY